VIASSPTPPTPAIAALIAPSSDSASARLSAFMLKVTSAEAPVSVPVLAGTKRAATAAALPPGWATAPDPTTGKPYYYHKKTQKVQWEPPTA